MSKTGKSDGAKEGPLEWAGLLLFVAAVMVFLVWLAASGKIVATFTPLLRAVGSMWTWLPAELGAPQALEVYRSARTFLQRPDLVDFWSFAAFVNLAVQPLIALAVAALLVWFALVIARPRHDVFRRFQDASELMRGISTIFTGTAPILHIRQDIARHKDPRWARQRFPEEVLFQERVDGDPLVGRLSQDPSVQQALPEVIERWFKGLEPTPGWAGNAKATQGAGHGRWVSRTLGRQIVDLTSLSDRAMFARNRPVQSESFADRFSDVGKVMFGMLCAHAFGGKPGMEDYRRARDQLNNSCRGAKHGLPKLDVAQWIFDKYRHSDMAGRMFAVHHWEYTYLFELFVQAKRRGKIPDSEFRWLKPADRTLWYVLNTVGRFTPHTDSAAAFNMHAFERKCARRNRLPLRINGQTGKLEPSIFVKGAVGKPGEGFGLIHEFEHWMAGTDEDDDEWWRDKHEWLASNRPVLAAATVVPLPGDTEAARQLQATSFDDVQSSARAKAEKASREAQLSELDALMGGPAGGARSG